MGSIQFGPQFGSDADPEERKPEGGDTSKRDESLVGGGTIGDSSEQVIVTSLTGPTEESHPGTQVSEVIEPLRFDSKTIPESLVEQPPMTSWVTEFTNLKPETHEVLETSTGRESSEGTDSAERVHAGEIRSAREDLRRALEDRAPAKILLPAARQVLDTLSALADDDQLWRTLQRRASQPQLVRLDALLAQDLVAILEYLGYRPPPAAEQFVRMLRDALKEGPEDDPAARVVAVSRAREVLELFAKKTQPLIDKAEAANAPDEAPGARRLKRFRPIAVKLLRIASTAAALVAAGSAVAAGPGIGTTAERQELARQLQVAFTALLHKLLAEAPAMAKPHERRVTATTRANDALENLAWALGDLPPVEQTDPRQWARRVDAFALECMSAVYGLLQVEVEAQTRGRSDLPWKEVVALRATVREIEDLVDQVRELMTGLLRSGQPPASQEVHQLADQLQAALQHLNRVLEAGSK